MELRQRVAVADADHDAVGQPLAYQAVQVRLGWFVQRGGGLVQQNHLRLGQQNPRKRHALQFARRQNMLPIFVAVQMLRQMPQRAFLQGLAQGCVIGFDVRITHRLAQRSLRYIRPLRHKQRLRHVGRCDFALAAECPKPRQHPQQRGFAAARRPFEQDAFAFFQAQVDIIQQRVAVGAQQADVFQLQAAFRAAVFGFRRGFGRVHAG